MYALDGQVAYILPKSGNGKKNRLPDREIAIEFVSPHLEDIRKTRRKKRRANCRPKFREACLTNVGLSTRGDLDSVRKKTYQSQNLALHSARKRESWLTSQCPLNRCGETVEGGQEKPGGEASLNRGESRLSLGGCGWWKGKGTIGSTRIRAINKKGTKKEGSLRSVRKGGAEKKNKSRELE